MSETIVGPPPGERTLTELRESHGPTHTGTGDQYNITYKEFVREVLQDSSPTPRPVLSEQLAWLRARFEPPPNFGHARDLLACGHTTLVLHGSRGSGRHSAARVLLCPARGSGALLRQLSADLGAADGPVLDPEQVADGDRLLLDLSEVDPTAFHAYQRDLPGLMARLPERDARLVVVITDWQERALWDDFSPHKVRIDRPDPRKVLARHLACEAIVLPEDATTDPEARRLLSSASMSTVARLARLVVEERDRRPDQPQSWLPTAANAVIGYPHEVEQLLDDHGDGVSRALLLTAAALEGARLDAVSSAERELLEVIGFPEAETHWLEGEGLLRRLNAIGARVDGRQVVFDRSGYAEAVVNRFWDEYAGLHDHLGAWMARVVASGPLSEDDRVRVTHGLAGQLLRARNIGLLARTAREWALHGGRSARGLAYVLLERAILDEDEHNGYQARYQLYEWARNPALPVRLAHVVLAVCDKVLATLYPDQAIVRLRLLTLHADHSTAEAAREILTRLADQTGLRRRILGLLARTVRIDYDLLRRLIDPSHLFSDQDRLMEDDWARDRIAACWRTVLDDPDHDRWQPLLWRWLDAAGEESRPELLDLLVAAAEPDRARLGRLFLVAHKWGTHRRTWAGSPRVVGALRDRIDRAQGIPSQPRTSSKEDAR